MSKRSLSTESIVKLFMPIKKVIECVSIRPSPAALPLSSKDTLQETSVRDILVAADINDSI